ncbi:MAG: HWE histidine kinase domain-containing protein [Sphingomicrobium sp.]
MTAPIQPSMEDLLSLIGDAIVSTDEQGRIILFNRAAEEMFDVTAAEVINRPIEMLLPDRFHISHRQEVHDYAATASAPRTMGHKREVVGRRGDGSEFPVEATLCRRVIDGRLILTVAVRDVTERKQLEEHRRLLNAELQHRMKNLMAVISSIVSMTARASGSVIAFRDAIQNRLLAVARSNDLLLAENPNKVDLRTLLNAELAAYSDRGHGNVVLRGPPVSVPARLVIALSLIAHELATNSAKHGALGRVGRQVTIAWSLEDDAEKQRLFLHWRETGGTEVTPPVKHGFGTELIEQSLCKAIRGKVQVDYHADGLDWHMELPIS